MTNSTKRTLCLGIFGGLLGTASLLAHQDVRVTRTDTPLYRVDAVSRSIKVVNFHHRRGSTEMDLKGTSLVPRAEGQVRVDSKEGATRVEVRADKLNPPQSNGAEYLTYVVWAITPEGRPQNLGELVLDGSDDGKLQAATELQSFGLIVTAEPYFAVTQPSDAIVMEAVISDGTTGTISPLDAKYELWPKGMYAQALPKAHQIWSPKTGKEAPVALVQAKHAMDIATSVGAQTYAADTMQKAAVDFKNAEDLFNNKGDRKKIETLSRHVAQLAEDARLISMKRADEERLAEERKASAERLAATEALAERERLAAEAKAREAELQASRERAAAEAQREASLREQQRLQAEKDRAAAEAKAAENARQLAEADRQKIREELRRQLNEVLTTRETARGLIVNMSDVLFDTGQHTLLPGAREKLARISGILLSHPGLNLAVEGHTDSVGSDEFNQGLSERRAESVKTYLISQGVKPEAISSAGFGETTPVADNNTAAGRQQNRRVEIVVSGESIQSSTTQSSGANLGR